MSRKDFQLIAGILRDIQTHDDGETVNLVAVVEAFANGLACTNSQFKRQLFIDAALGKVKLTARNAA